MDRLFILGFIIATLLSGCGNSFDAGLRVPPFEPPKVVDNPVPSFEHTLDDYLSRFRSDALLFRGVDISEREVTLIFEDLEYDPEEGGVIGYCATYYGGHKLISVDSTFWAHANDVQKEELMYHEMGHCLLDRRHDNRLESYGPYSLMHPYLLNSELYSRRRSEYLTELFENSPIFDADEKEQEIESYQMIKISPQGYVSCDH